MNVLRYRQLVQSWPHCWPSSVALGLNSAIALQRGPPGGEEGVEVLTRGPVHEAFAETMTFDPEPGVVVAKAAPDAIEELPPEQKPEGANVDWIPGYWAWDDERSDFLWVSGIWRALPPGRQWVPGYWGESGRGSQWTSGYWADAKASEVEYLPEPPATVEAGPNIAAPSADHIWLPGCWVWQQNRYAWRPGYWATASRTGSGSRPLRLGAARLCLRRWLLRLLGRPRGVLFAPVYFNSSIYYAARLLLLAGDGDQPGRVRQPSLLAAELRPLLLRRLLRLQLRHRGFSPWFSFNSSRYGYDPFYAHQRWHHRNDREWEQNVQADFQHRRDHEDARPPRTWTAQRALMTRDASSNQKSFVVAAPLDQFAKSKDRPLRFQALGQEERQRLAKHGQEIQKFRQERQKLETRAAGTSTADPAK